MLNVINIANQKKSTYDKILPQANKDLSKFVLVIDKYKKQLMEFENARCEQVHSSVNQFVVFEKFAEMNNKYDVNNFSKLIDTFSKQNEIQ